MVPRWRPFGQSAATRELTALGKVDRTLDTEWENKHQDWLAAPNLPNAITALEAALVAGNSDVAEEVADFIAQRSTAIRPLARIATSIGRPDDAVGGSDFEGIVTTLASVRDRLNRSPHDPLTWMDRARLHCSIGQRQPALRAARIALGLAPANRFLVRAACRLYLHCEMPDEAYSVLSRSGLTNRDPWIASAEIAISSIIQKAPRSVRAARQMAEGRSFSARDLTELHGSLATLDVESGKHIQAKKLFKKSLEDPNDNAVAQAGWASRHFSVPSISNEIIQRTPNTFEASAWRNFNIGAWEAALEATSSWANDEPFSTFPAGHGSFLAISMLEDYDRGIEFANRGLVANPHAAGLANNLAVGLAFKGELEKAQSIFLQYGLGSTGDVSNIATEGLLASREGRTLDAIELYERARDGAIAVGDPILYARATFHFLMEALRWEPSIHKDVINCADELIKRVNGKEFERYKEQIYLKAAIASTETHAQKNSVTVPSLNSLDSLLSGDYNSSRISRNTLLVE